MLKPKTRRDREESHGKSAALDDVRKHPNKRLNANIPAPLYQELQIQAAKDGRKINDLVIEWVNEYLSK